MADGGWRIPGGRLPPPRPETPLEPSGLLVPSLSTREAAEALSRKVELDPGINATRWVLGTRAPDEYELWRAKRLLLENGYVEMCMEAGSPAHHHYSIRPYRVDTDPGAEPRPVLTARLSALTDTLADELVRDGEVLVVFQRGSVWLERSPNVGVSGTWDA